MPPCLRDRLLPNGPIREKLAASLASLKIDLVRPRLPDRHYPGPDRCGGPGKGRRTGDNRAMRIEWAVDTDTGRVRRQNEDSALSLPDQGLAVLCDGMGGHRAGEVASRLAVETFAKVCLEEATPPEGLANPSRSDLPDVPLAALPLVSAAWAANDAVFAHSRSDDRYHGMGCTLAALRLREGTASFVTVGDSRLYLHREGRLYQLSEDHTRLRMLEQIGVALDPVEVRQIKGVLVRAIGTLPSVDVDYGSGATLAGDVWLLCSDGLTDELNDEEIGLILAAAPNARAAAKRCVIRAVEAGGRDNVTVVVAHILDGPAPTDAIAIPAPRTCAAPTTPPAAGVDRRTGSAHRHPRRQRGEETRSPEDRETPAQDDKQTCTQDAVRDLALPVDMLPDLDVTRSRTQCIRPILLER